MTKDAAASVSIAVTLEGLLRETAAAVLATPLEQTGVWEGGRIYTYTRVRIDRAIAGELEPHREVWVRTMGGKVGKVGHYVDGEPVLTIGRPSLLFLHPGPPGVYEVTARGQGQYGLLARDHTTRVVRNHAAGMLLAPRPAMLAKARPVPSAKGAAPLPVMAADALHDRPLEEVAEDIAVAFRHVHGR